MLKLRRVAWSREVAGAVDAASREAGAGKDEVLAAVELVSGQWVAGTRSAVYLPDDSTADGDGVRYRRVGWEKVERAGWDSEASVLRVYETAAYGDPLRVTELKVDDPGRFGQLLRERVNASVIVQRHVPLRGKKGTRIVGRRNPADPDAAIAWNFVLDKGLEPTQPGVLTDAEAALAALRDEFGI